MLQKTPSDNFTATMKLTFKPTEKYKGERTGLVVMGLDYAGLILENTDKGLVLSQVSCPKADKGTSETVNGTVDLKDNTIYLRAKFTSDGKKISKSEGGHGRPAERGDSPAFSYPYFSLPLFGCHSGISHADASIA